MQTSVGTAASGRHRSQYPTRCGSKGSPKAVTRVLLLADTRPRAEAVDAIAEAVAAGSHMMICADAPQDGTGSRREFPMAYFFAATAT